MRTILVVGQIRPAQLHSLTVRYLADVVHKYPTVQELMGPGRGTFLEGSYNSLLIGAGISAERRRQLVNTVGKRPQPPRVVAVTADAPGYETWQALPPEAGVDELAAALGCEPRRGDPLIVIVASTKGGVGKSTLAVNTAVTLGQRGYRVAVLEDDWTSRSVQPLLGIADGPYTSANLVADIIANDGYVSSELVQRCLVDAFGIKALIGPPSLLTEFPITADIARDILAVVGRELNIDVVVIDAPPDFIHTSCFTFGLLRGAESRPEAPLILVPVAPEAFLLRSVDDTVAAVTYLGHPEERIWPVVNCTRPTHDPESLRSSRVLWRAPAAIVPYCPEAEHVGRTRAPLAAARSRGRLWGSWRRWLLGVAGVADIQAAYGDLAGEIASLIGRRSGSHVS